MPKRQVSTIYQSVISHDLIETMRMTRPGPLERCSSDTNIKENSNEKCLVSSLWSTSSIHGLLALPVALRYGAELFCTHVLPGLERNPCEGARIKHFEASVCILRMRQLTMSKGRDKKLPEPKPGKSSIWSILHNLHSVAFSYLAI
jgi:hypothetical protein